MATANGVTGSVVARAAQQAGANTETQNGAVTRIYTDSTGNVIGADVRASGSTRDLVNVENQSGQKLYVGCPVQLNFLRGSKFAPSITGGSGSDAGNALSANSTDLSSSTSTAADLTGIPMLLEGPDETVPDGYVVGSGANILIETLDPVDDAGGSGDTPGAFTISARPLVVAILPDPATTTLPDGTCADLIDSYGAPAGMYRLDAAAHLWRRRDAGTGAATVGGGGLMTFRTEDGSVVASDVTTVILPNGSLVPVSAGVIKILQLALTSIDSGASE